MQFQLTEEQILIQKAAREIAIGACLPGVIERDEQQRFPGEQLEKLAELGFMGMMVSPERGVMPLPNPLWQKIWVITIF